YRPQEPIGLPDRSPTATPPHRRCIPLADHRRGQRPQRHILQRGQVQPQIPLTRLPITRADLRMITQPRAGIIAERLTAKVLIEPGPPEEASSPRRQPTIGVRPGPEGSRRGLPGTGWPDERRLVSAGWQFPHVAKPPTTNCHQTTTLPARHRTCTGST